MFRAVVMTLLLAVSPLLCPDPLSAQDRNGSAQVLLRSSKFGQASAFIDTDYDRFVRELITLTEIPAPPFKESARASAYLRMLREQGLSDVEQDAEGNVMGIRRGTRGRPMVAVVAHLDTVFPEGTNVTVKRDGTRLMAPGVGDDSRSLALILAVIRAMNAAKFETASDILFVGGVGEEGEGDLRGMKYLLEQGRYKNDIKEFIALDGNQVTGVINGALGSKKFRVTFKGPGGHSYNAFGLVNPAFALADAIQRIGKIAVPKSPKTTFNIGVIGGGTSVNSIPTEMFMDVDIRSESRQQLDELEATVTRAILTAVETENTTRSSANGRITTTNTILSIRPSGETSLESPLVRAVADALGAFGMSPHYGTQSTDANIPISHNIPAVTIGHGGDGGLAHSLDEWTDVEKGSSVEAVRVMLAVLLNVTGGH